MKALSTTEVNKLISSIPDTFDGIRNKAIILVLVDCGLRLGELLNIKTTDINLEQQLMRVNGKTGERVVRYGKTTWNAHVRYRMEDTEKTIAVLKQGGTNWFKALL